MSDLLNSASLVMIPSGYKEDVVYSVVPSDGSGDLSFTRASNGTRVNSAGLVEVCPWNLATNSENFSSWNLANVTVTANDITAPNGTLTADKLTISNNANDVKQTISVMPNSVYTWTFYVYGGTALGQQMRFYDNTNSANIEYYNYSSSVVLGAWVKIERTFTTPSGCYEIQAWVLAATSTIGTMWVWGAQLNIGSTAKPYFPTTDRLNVPRLTYQNGGGGCPSLLLEKQSTNVITYSEDLAQASWLVAQLTVTANATTSPDGTQNADKIAINNGLVGGYIYQSQSTTSSTIYTGSFFVKSAGIGFTKFWSSVSGSYCNAIINLSTGVITNGGFPFPTIPTATNFGNGWWRVSYTETSGGGSVPIYIDGGSTSNGGDITGNGTDGIYLWGAQLEASSYPTSYIPTTSSSATRVADLCNKTGISSLIGSGTGTWFMDFEMVQGAGSGNPFAFDLSDGTTSNRLFLYWGESSQTWNWGGVDTAITLPSTLRKKVAVKYSSGTGKLFCNGSLISTLSLSTAFSRLDIGQRFSNTFPMDGKINQAYFLTTSLTDAECQALTTI